MNRLRKADAAFKWSNIVAVKVILMTGASWNENWEAMSCSSVARPHLEVAACKFAIATIQSNK